MSLDGLGATVPLMEYAKQVPGAYGGYNSSNYISNWNYVRELPLVQEYYRARNLPIPGANP